MLKRIKKKIFDTLSKKGFYVVDNRRFVQEDDDLPVLLLRLSSYNKVKYLDHTLAVATYAIDIFSCEPGEEEIIDMEIPISKAMEEIAEEEPYVMGQSLYSMKILDDNGKGPITKHGVLFYRFVLGEEESHD